MGKSQEMEDSPCDRYTEILVAQCRFTFPIFLEKQLHAVFSDTSLSSPTAPFQISDFEARLRTNKANNMAVVNVIVC